MLDLGRALRRRVSRSISLRKPSFRRPMSKKVPNVQPQIESDSDAPDLDAERRRRNIRLYVYRLYEVRNWLAECLTEADVPSPIELEEALRSGVLLAKLANYFAPDLVPLEKIFDLDQSRLRDEGYNYRHTDNINLWRRACLSVRIKEIVLSDPLDVYAGRNVKTVLALVTLANQLYRLRKSPPIRDQTGNVSFTEETYNIVGSKGMFLNGNFALGPTTAQAIALPDSPTVEMVLKAVKDAILEKNLTAFKKALTSTTFIVHVDQDYLDEYFGVLVTNFENNIDAVTLDEIQSIIVSINRTNGLSKLYELLKTKEVDLNVFAHIILSLDVCDGRILEAYLTVYLDELRILWEKEEFDLRSIKKVIAIVNAAADLREATFGRHPTRIFEVLKDPNLHLKVNITPECSERYAANLIEYYSEPEAPLLYGYGLNCLLQQADLFLFRTAVSEMDKTFIATILRRASPDYVDENTPFYLNQIFLFDEEDLDDAFAHLAKLVEDVNHTVDVEKKIALQLFALNEALLKNNRKDFDQAVEEILLLIDSPVKPCCQLSNVFNLMDAELIRISEGKKQKRLYCMKHDFGLGEIRVQQVDENGNEQLVVGSADTVTAKLQPWALTLAEFQGCIEKALEQFEDDNILVDTPVTQALKALNDNETLFDLMNSASPSLGSFRKLVQVLQKNSNIYDEEILLEDLKTQARKIIESNMEMHHRLRETEQSIGLLVKNFRSLNRPEDPKAVKKQKDNSVSEPNVTLSDTSLIDWPDEKLASDIMLETKLLVVKLLRSGLEGETVKDLMENAEFSGVDDDNLEEVNELQAKLNMNVNSLLKQGLLTSTGDFSDILRSMAEDIREDRERRESRLVEIRDLQNLLGYSERQKKEMQSQIEMYEAYEHGCIESIVGGIPSIALADDGSRKVKKFIQRKLKAVGKREAISLNSDKLIRKKLLFMDDPTTPKQVSKYSIKISPADEVGHYKIECYRQNKFETAKTVDFEKLLRREDEEEVRLRFHGPLVFNCSELRKFIDLKFHYKISS
ncbi:unnamed protein product [Bursaphelenchus okinawaensis]|uniref:Calponin-homology (CH) domain-containing protein n=1 Tax=Bursaphelenchus okinawaensis TaxID=465554 RepID=A0A811JU10_9BILA|nr:unnamed protein product [Bursaphelenchus okinawaensis]CAG9083208.1 unnamed protein product [Bursaphelenchus okinawaensis]